MMGQVVIPKAKNRSAREIISIGPYWQQKLELMAAIEDKAKSEIWRDALREHIRSYEERFGELMVTPEAVAS